MSIPCNISPLGAASLLPAGYTRLDFLAAPSGGVGFNLEYEPTADSGFRTDYEVLSSAAQYQNVLSSVGIRHNSNGSVATDVVIYTAHFNNAAYKVFSAKALANGTVWLFAPGGAFPIGQRLQADFNWLNDSRLRFAGRAEDGIPTGLIQRDNVQTWLFCLPMSPDQSLHGRVYSAAISEGGRIVRNFVPAVDRSGQCCVVDTINKRTYLSSTDGQLVAGVGTVVQLTAMLRNLPATGGELTLSLPTEANTPEVAEALQACHDTKGWTITVHEYRAAAAATYSLRRVREVVWCRRLQSEYGGYVDASGLHWTIEQCTTIFGELGQVPSAYGYEAFDSIEQALEKWELVHYFPQPDEE